LLVALLATPDVTRIDAELGQRPRASLVLTQQLVPVEVKITDDGYLAILRYWSSTAPPREHRRPC
jgi:hypothetical protein